MIVSSKKDKYLGFTKNCLLSRRARWTSWQGGERQQHRREEEHDQPSSWESRPKGRPDQTLIKKKAWALGSWDKHPRMQMFTNFVSKRYLDLIRGHSE